MAVCLHKGAVFLLKRQKCIIFAKNNLCFWEMEKNDNNIVAGGAERMVLRTEGLVKRYGKRTVVNNVSFDVKQGEIVGLLGPNGAGKTTSFYMTTGLVVPNGGRIFLNDEEITKYPVYKRARAGIGYLAQEASVFRKLSVEDNIASVLELTGKPKEYQSRHGFGQPQRQYDQHHNNRRLGWLRL